MPGFSGAGGVRKERKRGAQTAPPRALSASEGKGGGASKRAGPEPELPPERLLNCVSAPLSLRRGGWNPREPPSQWAPRFLPPSANGGARSWGVRQPGLHLPPRPASPPPSLCVWARLAAGSRLGRSHSVVRPGLLWRSRPRLCVPTSARPRGAAPGTGSLLPRPGQQQRARARRASERARRRERRPRGRGEGGDRAAVAEDAGVPGGPLGPDQRQVEERVGGQQRDAPGRRAAQGRVRAALPAAPHGAQPAAARRGRQQQGAPRLLQRRGARAHPGARLRDGRGSRPRRCRQGKAARRRMGGATAGDRRLTAAARARRRGCGAGPPAGSPWSPRLPAREGRGLGTSRSDARLARLRGPCALRSRCRRGLPSPGLKTPAGSAPAREPKFERFPAFVP